VVSFAHIETYDGASFVYANDVVDTAIHSINGTAYLYTLSSGPTAAITSYEIHSGQSLSLAHSHVLPAGTGLTIPSNIEIIDSINGPVMMTSGRSWQASFSLDLQDGGEFGARQALTGNGAQAPTVLTGIDGASPLIVTADATGVGLTSHTLRILSMNMPLGSLR